MIVKKYQGETETEAIMKANEDLGSSAVVLNVKTLKQRGIFRLFRKDMVEVTAALEENEFASSVKDRKPTVGSSMGSTNSRIDLLAGDKLSLQPETAVIEQKLDSLHNLLKSQMNANLEARAAAAREPDEDDLAANGEKIVQERENTNLKFLKLIYKKLIDNEVDERFADQIVSEIESSLKKESNLDSILSAVYQKIILKLGEPASIKIGDKPKVIFFIGPTGVGKTTTIAKIASRFKLNEHAKVAFITSDTYRIAAVEQLNTYASIIDSPVSVVYSPEELESCIREYKQYDLIMVDTAGRSHKSGEQMMELADLLEKARACSDIFDIEIYLTLSITTKYKDLVNITDTYKDIEGWSVIFTKLDETCALGNILNVRLLTQAPLSYTASGQNVPNDIEVIDEQALARQLLGGNV